MKERKVRIDVAALAGALELEILTPGKGAIEFTTGEINRPGLQFTGYYSHFFEQRVQLVGNAEMHYLKGLDLTERDECMQRFMAAGIPCVICARGNRPPDEMLHYAQEYSVPVFLSNSITDDISHSITAYVGRALAPKVLMHGVLMDVFGVGILLKGESGMGKSETALEMIKQGHRLVADDVVEITRVSPNRVSGRAPELTRHLMEVRGIGIVDVRYLFGIGAVILEKSIDLVVDLELWNASSEYERIGRDLQYSKILGVDVPTTLIPVSPGRNLAVVIEVAARKFRLNRLGYDMMSDAGHRIWGTRNDGD